MDSFQAKIGSKRMRKRKKKFIFSFRSNPTRKRKFQKDGKKILKTKNYHCGFISRKIRLEKAEEETK